ncbi:uncharacterized protein PG986_002638 [Apiospora aurea]|uniref:Uncharacterized protein n=1 Tax=Apiospora aurea TaxID=335848 RepID=A0ABR1QPW1_9PEZI
MDSNDMNPKPPPPILLFLTCEWKAGCSRVEKWCIPYFFLACPHPSLSPSGASSHLDRGRKFAHLPIWVTAYADYHEVVSAILSPYGKLLARCTQWDEAISNLSLDPGCFSTIWPCRDGVWNPGIPPGASHSSWPSLITVKLPWAALGVHAG